MKKRIPKNSPLIPFTDITFYYDKWRGFFTFQTIGASYKLFFVENEEGTNFNVIAILHKSGKCPFCKERNIEMMNENICKVLYEEREKVLEGLLNNPSIRLRWLLKKEENREE